MKPADTSLRFGKSEMSLFLAVVVLLVLITRFLRGWPEAGPAPVGGQGRVIEVKLHLPGISSFWMESGKKI